MADITIPAPAKINCVLRIVGRRPDGYHLLQMLNVPLTLADTVTVSTTGHGGGITLQCDHPDVPSGSTNLCYRAAVAMRETAGRGDPIAIHLIKRIPIGGGLGGGSSDAAAVLQALNQLWGLGWSVGQLAEVGVRCGADVPFFCQGRPAIVEGIGEHVTICEEFPKLWILLVNPNIQISTKWVYQQYDFSLTATTPHGSQLPRFFERFEAVAALVTNDLGPVTTERYPVIREMVDALVTVGASAAAMSGSGATVFGLFATREARDRAAQEIAQPEWVVIPTESI